MYYRFPRRCNGLEQSKGEVRINWLTQVHLKAGRPNGVCTINIIASDSHYKLHIRWSLLSPTVLPTNNRLIHSRLITQLLLLDWAVDMTDFSVTDVLFYARISRFWRHSCGHVSHMSSHQTSLSDLLSAASVSFWQCPHTWVQSLWWPPCIVLANSCYHQYESPCHGAIYVLTGI